MSTNCPTCGPTVTEQHPRLDVLRCANCKEWLSTNDSTPDPTAGERPRCVRCEVPIYLDGDVWRREATGSSFCTRNPAGGGHEPAPATPGADASTPASEGPTEADVRDRLIAWVEAEGLSVPATARLMLILGDRDKIRVADAEAKARADERERIARAIEALRDGHPLGSHGRQHNDTVDACLRIARGDA